MSNCFFCDIQKQGDNQRIIKNKYFFSRYDDFPVSKGHCEIIPKKHIVSFFDLTPKQTQSMYSLIKSTKSIIKKKFKPDGYNIGLNEGKAAGATQEHLHIHIIPRYKGDAKNPQGGIRNIFFHKADYFPKLKKIPAKRCYM